jgi:hypothetical protein
MGVYNPIINISWPLPGAFGITLTLGLVFATVIIYLIIYYYQLKKQTRVQNYQLFLLHVKRKGLTNYEIKILRKMSAYLKFDNIRDLVNNAALFESSLMGFTDYIKSQNKKKKNIINIIRNIVLIHKKIFDKTPYLKPFESISELEDGEIIYLTDDENNAFPGKVTGRGNGFVSITLFMPAKNIELFENEKPVSLHVIRQYDAEYMARTVTAGIEMNQLRVKDTAEITKEREFRFPYINVTLSAFITVEKPAVQEEPDDPPESTDKTTETETETLECTVVQLNEYECVLRSNIELEFDKQFPLTFHLGTFKLSTMAQVIASRTVEKESVYYLTMKFTDMSNPARTVLRKFIAKNM